MAGNNDRGLWTKWEMRRMDNQYLFGFPEGFEEERGGTDLSRDAR